MLSEAAEAALPLLTGRSPVIRLRRSTAFAFLALTWATIAGGTLVGGQAYIAQMRHDQEQAALSRAEAAARSLEQYLLRTLEAIDLFHDMVQRRQALLASGDTAGAAAIGAQVIALAGDERFNILQVATVGPDGWTTWTTTPDAPRVDLSDREHFAVHRSGRMEMFVSAPLVGRQSQRQAVQFTRPLSDAAGRFGGVTVVSLDAVAFSKGLQTLPFAGGDALTIFRSDGVVLARSRDPDSTIGTRLSLPGGGSNHITRGRLVSTLDGVERFIYRRDVDGTSLAVGVGLDTGAELASFEIIRKAVNASTAGIVLLSLTLALLALFWIERRRAEDSLQAALTRLESSQRMDALGRLVSGVAHDFNHVLQAVLSGVYFIKKTSGDPAAVARYAGMIAAAAQRGTSVTRRLLSLARSDGLQLEAVEPRAVLDGIAELLHHTLGHNTRVVVKASPGLPMVLTDRRQLEATLVNLAINARDAMQPRGGTITLAAAPSSLPAGSASPEAPGLCLAVQDTGAGMDTAVLAQARDPFFTTKPRGEGTGLGLTMASGFAEQSGGALAIESEAGRGTTVRLWLPLAPVEAEDQPARMGADTAA
jgi:signal transduction histidine kinase